VTRRRTLVRVIGKTDVDNLIAVVATFSDNGFVFPAARIADETLREAALNSDYPFRMFATADLDVAHPDGLLLADFEAAPEPDA